MKKLLLTLSIFSTFSFAFAAPFTSFQLATSTLTNGFVLQTNGQSNRWVATSSLGLTASVASSSIWSTLTATYPILFNNSTGIISTGFSTSTINNFTAANSFTATTTMAALKLTGYFIDSVNSNGTTGQVLQSTGTSTIWATISSSGVTNAYASSTFPSFTYGSSTYLGSTYATSTFVTYPYASSTYGLLGANNTWTGTNAFATTTASRLSTTENINASGTLGVTGNGWFSSVLYVGGSPASAAAVLDIHQTANTSSGALRVINVANTASVRFWADAVMGHVSGGSTDALPLGINASGAGDVTIGNGSIVGINATSSTVTFNIKGKAGTSDIFNAASSTGTSLFNIASNGRIHVVGKMGIGTSTPASQLSVASGTIAVTSYDWGTATSTSMIIDWQKANTQQMKISTSTITVNFLNATTTPGAYLSVFVCNPTAGTAGAITWNGVYWPSQTAPTQTTTANHCDKWSFQAINGTSSIIVIGAATVNF